MLGNFMLSRASILVLATFLLALAAPPTDEPIDDYCTGGCEGCFDKETTCYDDMSLSLYCGAISPVGSDDIIYCWRNEWVD